MAETWEKIAFVGDAPTAHAASHTDTTDDIQSATSGQKGVATAAQITKLDGIEAGAESGSAADSIMWAVLLGSSGKTVAGAVGAGAPYVHPNHSGDVTSVADGALTIANDAVTYAKVQNVSATDKILGRATAGAGDVEELACTAFARSILDDANAAAVLATIGAAALGANADITSTTALTAITTATLTLSGDLLVNGGDIGITADTDLLQLASGVLTVNGNVIIGDTTSTYKLRVLSTGTSLLEMESTSASNYGTIQERYHNSASPAANDFIAQNNFVGKDSGGNKTLFWRERYCASDVTDGSEDVYLEWQCMRAGTGGVPSFKFYGTGSGQADLEWVTFSPDIKKDLQKVELTADDYLNWALGDAKKPVKPYRGLFNKNNIPMGCTVKSEDEEMEKYGKGLAKISIGTAIWAEDANKKIKELEKEVELLKAA